MKPNVLLIRADANRAIGTGHVMRCLALSQAWQDSGGTVSLAAAELPDTLSQRLAAEGISLNRIPATPGGPQDASGTVAQARRHGADWVVIDGDHFGSDFLDTVRAAGFRVLLIDDFADRETFPADLIVNPNLDENEEPYRKRRSAAPLRMGPSHVLLRREFRHVTEKREIPETGNRILVTLGGSDPDNLTLKIAAALAQRSHLEVTVVAGVSYDKMEELGKLKASNLRVVFNPANIVQLMKDSDQAIIAAGGTLWELLCIGCAVLSYSRNTVQVSVVHVLSDRGVVVDMGETNHFDPAKLLASVEILLGLRAARERMSSLGRALVDGMGAARVVETMQSLGTL